MQIKFMLAESCILTCHEHKLEISLAYYDKLLKIVSFMSLKLLFDNKILSVSD